ncbi:MAG: acyl-ACP--UDP-N-acetylglucosamine O-acyltransferase [Planctomycetota bacterium]
MSVVIAQTAVVDPRAQLGNNVRIGHFCVIGPQAKIGDSTVLEEHVSVTGDTTIGENNQIFQNCVLGGLPQDTGFNRNAPTRVVIGDNNVFREHCTVNRATEKEEGVTEVGHDNFFMVNTHIGHDCHVGDRIVIANNGMLGGHVRVANDVTIAGGCGIVQFTSIGQLCFVGALTRLSQDAPPFTIVEGNPGQPRALNTIGLKRHGYPREDISVLHQTYKLLYRERVGLDAAKQAIEAQGPLRPAVKELLDCVAFANEARHGRGQEHRIRNAA